MQDHRFPTRTTGGTLLALLALVATWAAMHASMLAFRGVPLIGADLVDTDSYMRLVRVDELVRNWQWFDTTIARANAPYGDVLHWTRPFDVLLILLALPATLVMSVEQAIELAGMVVSPLLQLATALLHVWALRPVIRPQTWFLPAIALFVQPGALGYAMVGRADHHAFLLLVFVLAAGFMLRALGSAFDNRAALLAGVAAGLGIWLSVEFLLVVALCLAGLGLPWLFGERERAVQSKWYALGLCCTILLALLVERPLGQLLAPSYDKVSSVQFLLAVCFLLFWRIAETWEFQRSRHARFLHRAALGVSGATAVALVVAAVYPLFFAGPMAGVDPRIVPIWLDRVLEMQPLVPNDRESLGRFLLFLGGVALVSLPLLKVLVDERDSPRFFTLLFIALSCLLLAIVATRHMRFSSYAEIAFVMAFAVVLDRFLRWSGRIGNDLLRGLLRGGFVGILLLGPILAGGTLITKNAEASDAASCNLREVAGFLQGDPRWAAPQIVLAFMDVGPELLYRTRHQVIGTPYHRNGDGIYDGHLLLATADDETARTLASRRGVDLVLLCGTPAERAFYAPQHGEQNLYQRLAEGTPPAWLEPVALPATLQGAPRLYRTVD